MTHDGASKRSHWNGVTESIAEKNKKRSMIAFQDPHWAPPVLSAVTVMHEIMGEI